MMLRAAARSDVGRKRAANEDRYALAPDLGLYLVADGMGGHRAGRVASELAAETTLAALRTLEAAEASPTDKLRYAVAAANRAVLSAARARPELTGMGTTLVALLAGRGRVALAHVGDSRAYLIRGGRIRQLTDDHSLVAELVRRREISARDARGHPHRHVLTRALGVRRAVEADLAELTPAADDHFVLCSDGLTAHVDDAEIVRAVAGDPELEGVCERLVELANARGGDDNISVVLVRCEKSE